MNLSFASDNHSSIHPEILKVFSESPDHYHSYGEDDLSKTLRKKIKTLFGESAHGFHVLNGTAANVLALASLVNSYESVLCSDQSHLNTDECGAPEKNIGCKLIPVKSFNGKVTVEELNKHLIRKGDQHFSQIKALSITQPTELGTLYSFEEMQALSKFCQTNNLRFHIDGARFIYAPYLLKKSFLELTSGLNVDALSFGGTKNGLFLCELVILFSKKSEDKTLQNFRYLRKQMMQLPSKTRLLSAQWLKFLEQDNHSEVPLWLKVAKTGHKQAQYLKQELKKNEIKVAYPVEANSVFAFLPKEFTKDLKKEAFFYIWNEQTWMSRLMMSYDVEKHHIDTFIKKLSLLRKSLPKAE